MSQEIKDVEELRALTLSLLGALKKREKLSGKSYTDMTQKQVQKNGAELTWLGMDIDKLKRQIHAVSVDIGVAEPRSDYGDIDYNPSPFHKYRYKQRLPRCRQ